MMKNVSLVALIVVAIIGIAAAEVNRAVMLAAGRGAKDYCREAFVDLDKAIDLIDEARACQDAVRREDTLIQARGRLVSLRQRTADCVFELDRTKAVQAVATGKRHVWLCPMHMQVRQDRPGNCPICDTALVSTPPATQPVRAADSAAITRYWQP